MFKNKKLTALLTGTVLMCIFGGMFAIQLQQRRTDGW